ncbi:aminodeoxychorismate/anthranilate synthase component II [Planococcus shenhongbingii]|uniref:Aminodeoxychorismate/anthranilate synthase component II n=1 Tax=Planococcus shenhongbingii TaxID=3058398 RepID=A0ABT8NGH1_9BACL|nr:MULTISPECIES: aminodeoxychorismate/anthranilate synthase component II [unclassified Planococcus (in: firmicutes)]MDN7246829.1 aminodeoxychorismate/anthranilate synthase component II [Planococcus sp. N017]WKA58816.1 aminodeoxychorismate/anthranilate synthase component II [Planococcus sp. N016]
MILLIDHYDSFTYNIYQAAAEMGKDVEVVRYGVLSLEEIIAKQPEAIILSPGPGHPEALPDSIQLIQQVYQTIPILGICLGHQLIGAAFGGNIIQAPVIRHGKVSSITHNQQGIFAGMPKPLPVMRYHSLVIDAATVPECLNIDAVASDDNTIMAIRHEIFPVYGMQFHPESIGTPEGVQLLERFFIEIEQEIAVK